MRNFAPQARADLDHLVGWLLDQGCAPATAERLLTAVIEAADMIRKRPLIGHARSALLPEPFRFWSIPRCHLLLVYDPTGHTPTILRVLSTSRDLEPLLVDLPALRPNTSA